jgi:hypothetical protein
MALGADGAELKPAVSTNLSVLNHVEGHLGHANGNGKHSPNGHEGPKPVRADLREHTTLR